MHAFELDPDMLTLAGVFYPTGYVFAWMHETASWKFIGHVSAPAAVAGGDITAGE